MSLVKTSALNGIAVAVKMLTFLGINKVLAVMVGPAGYAIVGQFQNAVQMITTFASGALNTGVTKYTAEQASDEDFLRRLWRTASTIAISGSLLTAILISLFAKPLSAYFLKDPGFTGVFYWFAASLVFFVINTFLLAVLNGKKDIKNYVIANIVGSLFALIFTLVLSYVFRLYGALIALGTYQSVSFLVTLYLISRTSWFKVRDLFGEIDRAIAGKLFHYSLMALAAAVCAPLSHIFIRELLANKISWTAAGEWEAMWRLSGAYLLFITSTLSVYVLPRLSELKTSEEVKAEILSCLKLIIPSLLVAQILIYVLRHFVIRLLFSTEFYAIEDLFLIQLTGDMFKVIGWLLGYVMIAKGLTKQFIFSEVLFSLTFYLLIVVLMPMYGLKATAIAHLVNYVLYIGFVTIALRRKKIL